MTQIVQIPPPSSPQFGRSVKQWVETRDGLTGPIGLKPYRFVTVKDLYDSVFINALAGYKNSITRVNSDYGYASGTSAPHPPTNLQVTSEVFRATLTWDDPTNDNFWYIEVYRARVSAGATAPTVASAAKIASVPKTVESFIDTDVSSTSYDYYYWIRAVSYSGKASLWYDGYIEGSTTLDSAIDGLLEILNNQISDTNVFKIVADGFAIINPSEPGQTPKVPFIVGSVGGSTVVGIDGNLVVDETILARHIAAKTITADKFISTLYGDLNQAMSYVKTVLGAGDEYEHALILTDLTDGTPSNVDAIEHADYGISIRLAMATLWDDVNPWWDTAGKYWDQPTESSGSWTSAVMDMGASLKIQMSLLYTLVEDLASATDVVIKAQYSTDNISWGANTPGFDDGLWETLSQRNITGNIYRASGALYTVRFFKIKVELTATDTAKRIILHTMSFLGNIVNLFGIFVEQTIAVGGTVFNLQGFGQTPGITVTPVGAATLIPKITAQSAASVTIELRSLADVDVGGTANINIIGT